MKFFLAAFPILLILILMVGMRWSAARAGAAGYLAGLVIAIVWFGATPTLLAYAHMKALLFSLDVLIIIWAAFLLYRVADEAGAIRTIGLALPQLTPDRGLQTLIIGWVFASFLQGVGGFGVPVAVTAPLLVGLGLSPLAAVVVPSVGHGWSVTFGSMGSSFQALVAATGLPAETLGPPAAWMLGIACPLSGWMIAHAIGQWPEVRRLFVPTAIWGCVMGLVQFVVVFLGGWNIGAFVGGIAGLLITPWLVRRFPRRSTRPNNPAALSAGSPSHLSTPSTPPAVRISYADQAVALSAYLILIAITLAVQLIPAVHVFFNRVILEVQFPEIVSALGFTTPAGPGRRISLLGHTGSLLFYASVLAFGVYRLAGCYRVGAASRILNGTIQRVLPSSVSILSMIAMALVMEHVGMTSTLALALANGTGQFFPIIAPWIGAVGAFMTGSNTNSNVVFGALQLHTAELIGVPAAAVLAAQTAGAALGSVAAPAKVVVGSSTAGMAGKEGVVLQSLGVYSAILLMVISLLSVIAVAWME